jgi:hypothetical protein
MPTKTYRRKLRTKAANIIKTPFNTYIVPSVIDNYCGENELEKIQNYFYNVLDMITQHDKIANIVSLLNNIIGSVKSAVDYYNILDMIENNLISVVCNIADGMSNNIICSRIEYIKTYIQQLPSDSDDLGPVSTMILQVIDSVISQVDFNIVKKNIGDIHTYIQNTYGEMTQIDIIHDNILSIICNIGDGMSTGIICSRIEYLRTLISQI